MNKADVVVIGGGPAGIEAAYNLARDNHKVVLVEKEEEIFGHMQTAYTLFPNFQDASEIRSSLLQKTKHGNITLYNNSEVTQVSRENDFWRVQTINGLDFIAPAVLLASGFKTFDARYKEELGYGIYKGVITSVEFEEMLKVGKIQTANGEKPRRIAFLNCVGSRDEKVGNHYCSRVCCINAVKLSIEAKKQLPEVEAYCFYMDIRMSGQFYEELYRKSQEDFDVNYIRGRISEVAPTFDNRLQVKCEDTLSQTPLKMTVDLLVLMIGIEASEGTARIGEQVGVNGEYNFSKSISLHTADNKTKHRGFFLAGTCKRPLTVPETMADARAAALEIDLYLKSLSQ